MLKYNLDITTQKEVETIVLQTYYNPQHEDKPQHSHNIYRRKNYMITNIK